MSEADVMTAQWTAEGIARATGGVLLGGAASAAAEGVSTDTRTLRPGEAFVALRGPNFDGHDFLADAVARGAAGLVVARDGPAPPPEAGFAVGVDDTLRALGEMARRHRARFDIPVVGVTGSNGKTTTKEMIGAILAEGGPALASEGNLNNLVGLPLQVLRLGPGHRRAVFEMGMNRPGEIRRLAEIAAPDVGVITNIAPAHLEGLGSVEAVREAKGELLEGVGPEGCAVLCADDPHGRLLADRFRAGGGRVVTFGFAEGSDARAREVRFSAGGGTRFALALRGGDEAEARIAALGRHNVLNALAAAAAALALDAPAGEILRGLARAALLPMRLSAGEIAGRPGCFLLNDAYNANPESVRGALETAAALKGGGRLFALLGDMAELGAHAGGAHREAGRAAAAAADFLAAVGPWMALAVEEARGAGMPPERAVHFESPGAAAAWAAERLRPGDWVLVKGSRSTRMERAAEELAG